MGRVLRQLKHGWNLFASENEQLSNNGGYAMNSPRMNRSSSRLYSDKSFVTSIYNRLAVDYASVEFIHAKLDDNDVAKEVVRDGLHECLSLDANVDQSAHALKIDFAMTLFEAGEACIIPVNTDLDPLRSASYGIRDLRVATVAGRSPRRLLLNVYDDREVDGQGRPVNGGIIKQRWVPKEFVVYQENPFYSIMNEPNGLLQRLITKLNLMDDIDQAAASGKLDMILQLPYNVRMDSRQKQAEERRKALREQLMNDELGIGYIDISEKVIQLNRPVENKLLEQIEYLGKKVMDELGLTPEIMNGTADRNAINNYMDRTIEPIANGTRLEYTRKFLTKTARTQRHSVEIYTDPLKIIPIDELAEVADKLIRNAVVTANELRPKIGYRPSDQPGADKLNNPNMPDKDQAASTGELPEPAPLRALPAPEEVADA